MTDQEPLRRPMVVLLGTLDTKGHEYAFLRDRIRARDVDINDAALAVAMAERPYELMED